MAHQLRHLSAQYEDGSISSNHTLLSIAFCDPRHRHRLQTNSARKRQEVRPVEVRLGALRLFTRRIQITLSLQHDMERQHMSPHTHRQEDIDSRSV